MIFNRQAFRSTFILLMLPVGVVSCWVPKEAGQVMRRDIRDLRDEAQAARRGIDQQKAQLSEQLILADDRIQKVDSKIQELNRAARKTDAGLGVRMDELQRELQELRGINELLTYRLDQVEIHRKQIESMGKRVEVLETAVPKHEPEKPKKTVQQSTPAAPKGKVALLALGKKLLKEAKYADARGVLREVIRRWPKEIGITDNALFHIGESYFRTKKFRSGMQEYIQVVEGFAKGKFADDAYYRIGNCSLLLGNLEDASIFFSEILKNHHQSPLIKLAKGKLLEIEKLLAKEKKGKK